LLGAGSLFLASAGNQVGPGHFSRFVADGVEKFSIHSEGEIGSRGRSFLAIRPLLWSADGWPLAGEIPASGTYQLCSQRTGEVLQAPPDAARVGPPQTAAYLCRDHQRWTLTAAAGGRFRITNTATGAALQAAGGGKEPRRLTLAKVAVNDQQLWQIDQLADGAYRIATSDLQFVIATATGPLAGHRLTLEPFTGNAAQRWLIRNP
jgi:arabinan endo-1,5-alpha-L-arabinosidase